MPLFSNYNIKKWIVFAFLLQIASVFNVFAQNNLHVVILGDSNTWIGGDSCNVPKGWNKWFKDEFKPASCVSYARSGATWTNTPSTKANTKENIAVLGNDNVIYNQVLRLKEAVDAKKQQVPDLIIIAAGTNDAWFSSSRPGAFSDKPFAYEYDVKEIRVNQVTSLAESVYYSCELLLEYFPHAQIVLLTPLQSTAVEPIKIFQVGDIIEHCGRNLAIPVIRQDYNCICSRRERKHFFLTTDGTHTSVEGAKRNGHFIANQVKSILNQSYGN